MKILVVSSYLPYPLFSGGQIRLYNLLKELHKKHLITLVCEIRPNQTRDDIEEMRKICKEVIVVQRKKQWSLQNIMSSGFSSYPFLLIGHTSEEMKQHIADLLQREKFDLIHVETFYVLQNVPITQVPIVLAEHNIEYLVYERYKKNSSLWTRPLLSLDIAKIEYWEKKAWQRADALIAVSDEEKNNMKRKDITVVPNGVDLTKFTFQKPEEKFGQKEKKILFIGDFKWVQNQKALEFILKEIWPIVKFKTQSSKLKIMLWVVGRHIPDDLKSLGSDGVIFDEHAPKETEKIYQQSFILLAPITVGGGTSYKILESMASGLPVVTTPLGVCGIHATHKQEALVGLTAVELSEYVISLCSDKKLFASLANKARAHVEKNYAWPMIAKKLEKVYESVVTYK